VNKKDELARLRKQKAELEIEIATKDETIEKQNNLLGVVVETLENLSEMLRIEGFMKPEERAALEFRTESQLRRKLKRKKKLS